MNFKICKLIKRCIKTKYIDSVRNDQAKMRKLIIDSQILEDEDDGLIEKLDF